MIKVVSFDADGTLVSKDFMDAFWNIAIPKEYAKLSGLNFDAAKVEVDRRFHEIGERDIRWYSPQYWFDLLGLTKTPEMLMEDYKKYLKVYPEAKKVLGNLKERYSLIVISNAPREILDFELASLKGYFNHIFSVTTDFKEVRKTADFYTHVCSKLGVNPKELAHVGDHWDFDYVIPKNLGIKTFFLERTRSKKGEDVIHTLEEFVDKIDG